MYLACVMLVWNDIHFFISVSAASSQTGPGSSASSPVLVSSSLSPPPQFAPVAPARSNQKALYISLGFLYRISLHAKQLHFDHPWYTYQSLRLPLPLLISSPPSSNPPQITHVAFLPGLGVGMKLFIINNIYRKYPKVYKIVSKVVQRCKCIFINLRCS